MENEAQGRYTYMRRTNDWSESLFNLSAVNWRVPGVGVHPTEADPAPDPTPGNFLKK